MNGYAAVPSWMIADDTISGPALLTFAALASRSGFDSIHPGQELLAKEARCSVRRVRDALNELEALGVIERVSRRSRSGAKASTGYVLLSGRRPSSIAEQAAPDAGNENLPADNSTTYRQNRTIVPSIEITTSEITTSVREATLDEQFDEFWKAYPKRVGKASARRRYEQARRRASAETILAGVSRYAESLRVSGTESKHIKNPEGWLNADRWLDEVSLVPVAATPAEAMMARFASPSMMRDSGPVHDWSQGAISQ